MISFSSRESLELLLRLESVLFFCSKSKTEVFGVFTLELDGDSNENILSEGVEDEELGGDWTLLKALSFCCAKRPLMVNEW